MKTRKHLRVPLRVPARLRTTAADQDFELIELEDISWGGVFVRRDPPLAEGTRVILQFLMRDDSVLMEIWGMVVRLRPARPGKPAGNGIMFQEVDDDTRSLIQKMVDHTIEPLFDRS